MIIENKRNLLLDPLIDSNPITVQALGICSALAVTSALRPSLLMSVAVIAVCGFAGASVSLIRQYIPNSIRLIVQIVIIASFVVIVDQLLKAYAFETSKALSVYVFLIVTNCIVLGRVESFAMSHDVWPSFLDGIGNGLGYSLLLLVVASIRELLGAGALLGRSVLPVISDGGWYQPNGLLTLAPSAFLLIGLIIGGVRTWRPEQNEAREFFVKPARASESR
jgi:Na+-transporting NADH:ubiquinone oxidoreductase subunit D